MKNNLPIGGTSQLITLAEAVLLDANYRKQKTSILAEGVNPNVLPICETFSRDNIDTLLAQPGCAGVRIYFGMKTNFDICAVIVGVNADNEDMITPENELSRDPNIIIENGDRCPDNCPPPSELNS